MLHFFGGQIQNNTVINRFTLPSKREADSTDYVYEAPLLGEDHVPGRLRVTCSGVQGDHNVTWQTDNTVVGTPDGTVNCDPLRLNRQLPLTNYSSE